MSLACLAAVLLALLASPVQASREAALSLAKVPPPLTVSAAANGRLDVAGLRFKGCPRHSLRAFLRPGGAPADAELGSAAEPALDFDRRFDRATRSWVLGIDLPSGAAQPARLELRCRACRTADGGELSGLVASQDLQLQLGAGAEGASAPAGTLVILLQDATLPAAPGDAAAGAAPGGAAAFSASRRRLQQAGCSVTASGIPHSFASCKTMGPSSNGYSLSIYSTVEAASSGSLLKMALMASTNGGWAGFGIPASQSFPGMIGAKAVILWPTSSGANVAGFVLPNSYDQAAVNAAKGTFAINVTAVEAKPSGELLAVFSAALPDVAPATLTSANGFNFVYAMGPMSGTQIGDHTLGRFPYGQDSMTFKLASASSGGTGASAPSPSPAAAATPSPSPKPAAGVFPPLGEGDKGGDHEGEHDGEHGGHGDGDGKQRPDEAGSGGTQAVPSGAAGANSTAGGPACTLQLAAGAAPKRFDGCSMISGVGGSFWVLWRSENASTAGKTLLTLGMNGTATGGNYVALGFPSTPGRMPGASSMILSTCSSGGTAASASGTGCTAGAVLQQYFLASTSASDVNPDGRLPVSNLSAAVVDGQLVGSFQMEVDAASTGRRRLLLLQSGLSLPLIFAAGPASSDGTPGRHRDDSSLSLPLLSTQSTGATVTGGGGSSDSALKAAHAWLAAIGWGVFVPAGIVMARSFKNLDPWWFHLHRIIQTLGFVMGTVALGLGFELAGGWSTTDTAHTVHRNLGVACTVLGATQFTAIVLRPKKGQRYRFAWELWHAWVGRSAAVLAIANIYYGMLHMWDGGLGAWTWASYSAVLAVIVAVAVVKDTTDWCSRRRAAAGAGARQTAPDSSPPRGAISSSYASQMPDEEAPGLPFSYSSSYSRGEHPAFQSSGTVTPGITPSLTPKSSNGWLKGQGGSSIDLRHLQQ